MCITCSKLERIKQWLDKAENDYQFYHLNESPSAAQIADILYGQRDAYQRVLELLETQ